MLAIGREISQRNVLNRSLVILIHRCSAISEGARMRVGHLRTYRKGGLSFQLEKCCPVSYSLWLSVLGKFVLYESTSYPLLRSWAVVGQEFRRRWLSVNCHLKKTNTSLKGLCSEELGLCRKASEAGGRVELG